MTRRGLPRSGFTLIEVLIAIALALMLGAAMLAFVHDMLFTRGRLMTFTAERRAASTLIERIESDLATCIVGDQRYGPGIVGDSARIRILSRGVSPQAASRGVDDPAALGDLMLGEYHHNPSTRIIEARRSAARALQQGYGAEMTALGGEIARVRFRYLVDRRWRTTYNSLDAGRLPDAVEIRVWFRLGENHAVESSGEQSMASSGSSPDSAVTGSGALPPPDRRRVVVIADAGGEVQQ